MTNHSEKKRRFGALKAWRFTRRSAAVAVAFLLVAAPAGASIIVQNYMEADVVAAPPCFVKLSGDDPVNSSQAGFSNDPAVDTVLVDNVNLLEEKLTVTGMTGDRVVYTDMVRYRNNCLEPITVQLSASEITGTAWADVAAEIWISNVPAPANIDPNLDPAPTDDWNDDPIDIPAGSTPGAFVETTGTVVVAPNTEVQGAIVVSSDVDFDTGTATVNWVASATI